MSSTPTIEQLVTAGLEHHRAGRLQQAEAAYRQVLALHADQPDALNLLGVIALQVGQPGEALKLLSRSVQISPNFASLNNLGEAFRHLGRLDDAIGAYQKSIELNPQHLDAYSNLGLALVARQRNDDAIKVLEAAVRIAPGRADAHDWLGCAYFEAGDPFRAAAEHRKAIELAADFAPAYANLGLALSKTGAMTEALAAADRAVELAPQSAESHGARAVVLDRAGRDQDAVAAFERAATLNPNRADYFGHRAQILERLDRLDDALAALRGGIVRSPNDARLHSSLSGILRKRKEFDAAVSAAETAIRVAPAYSDAHGNLALALLSKGDYLRGFHEYEWRWRCENFTTPPRDFNRPMWDGADPAGRIILVHTEQGFGDTIQFARYIPMLAARGAKVIVECQHALRKLMSRVSGVSRVIPSGLSLPDFDLHLPLLSLPRAFQTTLETVPRDVPYMSADPDRVRAWRDRFDFAKGKLHVGLIWAGNAKPDSKRTIPSEALKPFAGLSQVQFIGLQRHDADTYQPPPPELNLLDVSNDLTDFHETAAAMSALDLILTIDSGPAHLAGALGCKTWTLLHSSPDWRWLLERKDSPWYSTMRLFRQCREHDWTSVIEQVRKELPSAAASLQ